MRWIMRLEPIAGPAEQLNPTAMCISKAFRLDGTTPVWRFAIGDALLEKRVWMRHGENTTYVQYAMLRGSQSIELELRTLINYRDFHSNTHAGDWHMKIDVVKNGLQITAFDGAIPFYLLSADAAIEPRHEWSRDYFLPLEKYRGLDDREDYLLAAVFRAMLQLNQSVTIVFSTNASAALDGDVARAQNAKRESACSRSGLPPMRRPHLQHPLGFDNSFSPRTNLW